MSITNPRTRRLLAEQQYFDEIARTTGASPISSEVQERYRRLSFTTRCFPFGGAIAAAMPKVPGGRVLDVGCGQGGDSLLLSHLGAESVVGIDLSAESIALAERRLAVSPGIHEVRFLVGDVGDKALNSELGVFDVVWCSAILHHVLPELERTIVALRDRVRAGGRLVILEPAAPWPLLRKLRLALGKAPDATEDERPLERADINLIRSLLPEATVHFSRSIGRLTPFVLDGAYEPAPLYQKLAASSIQLADAAISILPGGKFLASSALIVWDAPHGTI